MYSKIYPIVISSILAFAVFAGISKAFENITAQEDDTSINQFGDMNEVKSQGNDHWLNNKILTRDQEEIV